MGACYGRVLEPAAGAGVFLDGAIERGAKEMVTVELDSISAKLLRCGYPTVTHKQGGFETFSETDLGGKFDLVIGNCYVLYYLRKSNRYCPA